MRPRITRTFIAALLLSTVAFSGAQAHEENTETRFIQVAADSREDRTALGELGMSIEFVRSDSVWGFADPVTIAEMKRAGYKVLGNFDKLTGRGGHHGAQDFPVADERFHNYAETKATLHSLANSNADIAKVVSIGKTIENRDIWALHINTTPEALLENRSQKPGAVFMGAHHAREHLSVEIPLMFAEHLLRNREDPKIAGLIDSRDIWIIPMVNPDGAEYDISGPSYKVWRKNRRDNGNGTFGVDLNRNYGYKWGTGGSSSTPSSDTFKGPAPFSEPESTAIKTFVESQANLKTLLSFHTYSELVLYPWGNTYDPIANSRDRQVFEKMATTMAAWNKYTPQQASDLYIASGDTTDWAYGEKGIFAFTFELSPKNAFGGAGFYPGARVIDKVFEDNLKPCLYMLDVSDDPYKVIEGSPTGFLRNYVEPTLNPATFWNNTPLG